MQGHRGDDRVNTADRKRMQIRNVTFSQLDVVQPERADVPTPYCEHFVGEIESDEMRIGIESGHLGQLRARPTSEIEDNIPWPDDFAGLRGMKKMSRGHYAPVPTCGGIRLHIRPVLHDDLRLAPAVPWLPH